MATPVNMTACGRHGYAVYTNGIMSAWTMMLSDAGKFKGSDIRVVNVQNGATVPSHSSPQYR